MCRHVTFGCDCLLRRDWGSCVQTDLSSASGSGQTTYSRHTDYRRGARWPYTTLFDIMRPLAEIRTVAPDTPLKTALEIMGSQNLNQLPVVSDHHVDGVVSRAQVLNYLHTRTELKV